MARTIFDSKTRQELDGRIARLTPQSQATFGKFTAPAMVCHLTDSVQVATGAAPARSKDTFLANPFVRRLIIYYMPWPKAKAQTVPEMLLTKPASWDADVARLRGLLNEAAARGSAAPWARHPAFGELTGKDYGVLLYRHFDHHLKQFGV